MGAPRRVWLSISEAKIGEEYCGYKSSDSPGSTHMGRVEYLGDGKGLVFGTTPVENLIELERETSWQEQEEWYYKRFDITNSKNQLNLLGLFNDMYDVGDAYHEMWNSWVGIDFYKMTSDILDEDFTLVGIAPAPYGCFAIDDPVAFVAEESNGTRFWCHGSEKWVTDMREQMKDIYEDYIKGR